MTSTNENLGFRLVVSELMQLAFIAGFTASHRGDELEPAWESYEVPPKLWDKISHYEPSPVSACPEGEVLLTATDREILEYLAGVPE